MKTLSPDQVTEQLGRLKVALVYDRANTAHGGAEKVLLALHQLLPQAPLLTSVYHPRAQWADRFRVVTSWLDKIPGASNRHRALAWAMPLAFESLDLSGFQVVVSVTSAEAKGVITKPDQLHCCYLLSPPRYLYSHRGEHLRHSPLSRLPGGRAITGAALSYLEWWDQVAIHRPDVVVPISRRVNQRLKKYYPQLAPSRRQPVIYPPVTVPTNRRQPRVSLPATFALVVSRLVMYKRLDLAVTACRRLKLPLVVVGTGPDRTRLERLADGGMTTFINTASDQEVAWLMSRAQALLMPGEEDFGITALEAVGQGTPVVLNRRSGVSELLKAGVHGELIDRVGESTVTAATRRAVATNYQTAIMRATAQKYNTSRFQERFGRLLLAAYHSARRHPPETASTLRNYIKLSSHVNR
ncbi:MAG: hypothetical protein COU69_01755 [Candidatus Pacebacteria bacterium CG10_big_fil_rev_8_21_14_0_10_56_10]|nr:MAG: hypothetical protein COU69_01755 [Candidatus Pacebacteria bacterium CG10_big_fil_rev_8_21_14_0_10_56_10]